MTNNSSRSISGEVGALWQALISAWQNMLSRPMFSWFGPELTVKLVHVDGTVSYWLSSGPSVRPWSGANSGQFVAVEIPDDLLLIKRILLPSMSESDVRQALELAAIASSPFLAQDLIWTSQRISSTSAQVCADLSMGSRKQIDAYLMSISEALPNGVQPQVWTVRENRPTCLPGYGEGTMLKALAIRRMCSYGLVLTAICLVGAMAVTSTAQLRFRALEASKSFDTLKSKTTEELKKKGALQDVNELVSALKAVTSESVDPVQITSRMTDLLGDDTALVSLSVQASKISIYGQTPNAAALMQHLSTQPEIRDVKAPVAAVRPNSGAKDNFTLEFNFAPLPSPKDAKATGTIDGASAPAPALTVSSPVSPASQPKGTQTPPAVSVSSPKAASVGGATFGGSVTSSGKRP